MFRRFWQIWAGPRGSAASSAIARTRLSNFGAWPLRQSRQSSFFTHKVTFPRHGPRTRRPGHGRAVLSASQSGIYGTVFMSIVMLVTDESMDYRTRQDLAFAIVHNIMGEADYTNKIARYWATGQLILASYSGSDIKVHGRLRPDPASGWTDDELEAVVMTAPDPDWPDGTLVFCQAVLFDPDPDAVYIAEHGNRATDAAEALLTKVEEFAKDHGGPVRGALLLMQPNGDWKSLYWDSKRWINVVYLEWQTAASMGFE
ncbi:hypothetical protein GGR53DRAFT_470587 [Hypoxylon sp. FL1150]|nr:hypothetical protein GGR53DRAFT_470587 [Hypoxylon sp. FL1150]